MVLLQRAEIILLRGGGVYLEVGWGKARLASSLCFLPCLAKKMVEEIQPQSPVFHSARRTQSDGLFNRTN